MRPIINLEDPAGKTVGCRLAPADSGKYGAGLQKTLNELYGTFPIRRGVYRFHSHEEADAWMMDHLVRKKSS